MTEARHARQINFVLPLIVLTAGPGCSGDKDTLYLSWPETVVFQAREAGATDGLERPESNSDSAPDAGGERTEAGQWPSVCPIISADEMCQSCVESSCAGACVACGASPDCRALLACIQTCSTSACIQLCKDASPGGLAPYDALKGVGGCMPSECDFECGAGGGGALVDAGDPGHTCSLAPNPTEACKECVTTQCLPVCQSCMQQEDCRGYADCASSCHEAPDCLRRCEARYPNAVQQYNALLGSDGCVWSQCPDACAM